MKITRTLTLLALSAASAACGGLTERSSGLVEGRLTPCPSAPRCVSSLATDPRHAVAPIVLARGGPEAWAGVVAAVAASPRTTVVEKTQTYLRAEVISPWHFYTDDLELHWATPPQVEVRSSGRIGYYDFGVNRDRVEALRARLAELGIARPAATP